MNSFHLETVIPDPEKAEQVTVGYYPTADYLGKCVLVPLIHVFIAQ